MTLIAAFPCSRSTALICADSQETVGDYRATRQKIRPKKCGFFDLAIGGSGHGYVIDAFVHRLENITSASNAASLAAWESLFKREIKKFHADKRKSYSKKDRQMAGIVCVYHRPSRKFGLWKLQADELIPIVSEPVLVGWAETLYENEATRLYGPNMELTQAVFLGLRVLTLGQVTSNYIHDPFTLIVATAGGLWEVAPEKVRSLQERAIQFNKQLDAIMLASPDITVRPETFDKQLEDFVSTIRELRQQYLDRTVKTMFPDVGTLVEAMGNYRRDPLADFPRGIAFTMRGDYTVGYNIQTPEEMAKQGWMFEVAEQLKESSERLAKLLRGRGEPLFTETREIYFGGPSRS